MYSAKCAFKDIKTDNFNPSVHVDIMRENTEEIRTALPRVYREFIEVRRLHVYDISETSVSAKHVRFGTA